MKIFSGGPFGGQEETKWSPEGHLKRIKGPKRHLEVSCSCLDGLYMAIEALLER